MTWLGVGKRPFQLHLRTSSFGSLVASALFDDYFKICIAVSRLKKLEFRSRRRIFNNFRSYRPWYEQQGSRRRARNYGCCRNSGKGGCTNASIMRALNPCRRYDLRPCNCTMGCNFKANLAIIFAGLADVLSCIRSVVTTGFSPSLL